MPSSADNTTRHETGKKIEIVWDSRLPGKQTGCKDDTNNLEKKILSGREIVKCKR